MTKRFAISAALVSVLLASTGALAQSSGSGQAHKGGHGASTSRTEAQLEDLSQQLQLTEDQKAKIKPVLQDQSTKLRELRKDASLSQEERRAKSREIRQSAFSQIREILNPDQQKKTDAMPTTHSKGGKQKTNRPESK